MQWVHTVDTVTVSASLSSLIKALLGVETEERRRAVPNVRKAAPKIKSR
jgi:hypothetical protein